MNLLLHSRDRVLQPEFYMSIQISILNDIEAHAHNKNGSSGGMQRRPYVCL